MNGQSGILSKGESGSLQRLKKACSGAEGESSSGIRNSTPKCAVFRHDQSPRSTPEHFLPRPQAARKVREGFADWVNRCKDIQLRPSSQPKFRGKSAVMSEHVQERAVEGSAYHVMLAATFGRKGH